MLGLTLDRVELSFRIQRPIYRKSVAYKPFGEVSLTDRTRCDRAPILIQRDWDADYRPSRNEGVEIVRSLRSAPILQAVFSPAKLAALWSVDAPQPYARPVNFQGVTSPRVKRIAALEPSAPHPKKTFATISGTKQTSWLRAPTSENDHPERTSVRTTRRVPELVHSHDLFLWCRR